MSQGLPLLPGERLVWSGLRGQPARMPSGAVGCRMAYAIVMLSVFGVMGLVPMMAFSQTRGPAIVTIAFAIACIVAFRIYRKRPAIFVTDQRVVERSILGTTTVGLAHIRGYHRRIDKYRDRYGNTSEVATNIVVLL